MIFKLLSFIINKIIMSGRAILYTFGSFMSLPYIGNALAEYENGRWRLDKFIYISFIALATWPVSVPTLMYIEHKNNIKNKN